MAKLIGRGFERKIGYDKEGDAVMLITPTYLRSTPPVEFAIRQRDAWIYSEEHNPLFEKAMMELCLKIHEFYQLGIITPQRLSIIATVIQEGLDDLVQAKPAAEKGGQVIGEVTMTDGAGRKSTRDLTTNDVPDTVEEVVG